jgi:hypothetical protein
MGHLRMFLTTSKRLDHTDCHLLIMFKRDLRKLAFNLATYVIAETVR